MLQLKLAGAVVSGFVGFVGDRRALQTDGLGQNASRRRRDLLPTGGVQTAAWYARIDACREENFRGVDVADARHRVLIEQGDLHRAAGVAQTFVKLVASDDEPVGAEPVGPAGGSEATLVKQAYRSQPSPIPEQEPRMPSRLEPDLHPHMGERRRIGHQHEARHPRLDHQPLAARPPPPFQFDGHAFAEPVYRGDRPPGEPLLEGARSRLHRERPHRATRKRDARDSQPCQVRDPAAHRLHFGQFRHVSPGPRW